MDGQTTDEAMECPNCNGSGYVPVPKEDAAVESMQTPLPPRPKGGVYPSKVATNYVGEGDSREARYSVTMRYTVSGKVAGTISARDKADLGRMVEFWQRMAREQSMEIKRKH